MKVLQTYIRSFGKPNYVVIQDDGRVTQVLLRKIGYGWRIVLTADAEQGKNSKFKEFACAKFDCGTIKEVLATLFS